MSEDTAAQVSGPDELPTGVVRAEPWDGIGNEVTGVRYRKVHTRNGARLQLFVPRTEKTILLDPMVLEVLAEQTPEFFTHLIATRLGSEDA
ncbi:hypothetical protein [Gordonia paraffinivorans]|uniref:hypothetical protein n=1 Tax=Gordonia paraffinivorans TaxID=175628 RepID=UPI00242FE533|nr:hypothetical protein [Gordonia paraffinivorans]